MRTSFAWLALALASASLAVSAWAWRSRHASSNRSRVAIGTNVVLCIGILIGVLPSALGILDTVVGAGALLSSGALSIYALTRIVHGIER